MTTHTPTGGLSLRQDHHRPAGLFDLFRAEANRFRSRRFIGLALAGALIAFAVLMVILAFVQYAKPSPELLADATRQRDAVVAEQMQYYNQCLKTPPTGPGVPADATPEMLCGPEPTADGMPVDQFMDKHPFTLANTLPAGQAGLLGGLSMLLFVIGATWIGAEWSARTMMAQLFWETRRPRVLLVKAAVLSLAAALIAVLANLLWIGVSWVMATFKGSTTGLPKNYWSMVAGQGARGTLLVVLMALLGFAIAHLIRGTGAALGVAFFYFAIVQTALSAFRPAWQEWLLVTNATALVNRGGATITVPGKTVDAQGQVQDWHDLVISNLHGGLVIGGVVALLLAVGAYLFHRRDLT